MQGSIGPYYQSCQNAYPRKSTTVARSRPLTARASPLCLCATIPSLSSLDFRNSLSGSPNPLRRAAFVFLDMRHDPSPSQRNEGIQTTRQVRRFILRAGRVSAWALMRGGALRLMAQQGVRNLRTTQGAWSLKRVIGGARRPSRLAAQGVRRGRPAGRAAGGRAALSYKGLRCVVGLRGCRRSGGAGGGRPRAIAVSFHGKGSSGQLRYGSPSPIRSRWPKGTGRFFQATHLYICKVDRLQRGHAPVGLMQPYAV